MNDTINTIKLSYGRALGNREMFDIFYQKFTQGRPSIARQFRNIDMAHQKEMLKQSLSMAILFPQNNVVANRSMGKIKLSHGSEGMAIKPSDYRIWLDSLIDTLKVCDPYFNADLEKMWREVLGKTINYLTSK